MLTNQEIKEVAAHCKQKEAAVLRVYHAGGASRVRELVKTSASILGLEPPPEPDDRSEMSELDFS